MAVSLVAWLPESPSFQTTGPRPARVAALFRDGRGLGTALFWAVNLLNLLTIYFLLLWTPTISRDIGVGPAAAIVATTVYSLGVVASPAATSLIVDRHRDRAGPDDHARLRGRLYSGDRPSPAALRCFRRLAVRGRMRRWRPRGRERALRLDLFFRHSSHRRRLGPWLWTRGRRSGTLARRFAALPRLYGARDSRLRRCAGLCSGGDDGMARTSPNARRKRNARVRSSRWAARRRDIVMRSGAARMSSPRSPERCHAERPT